MSTELVPLIVLLVDQLFHSNDPKVGWTHMLTLVLKKTMPHCLRHWGQCSHHPACAGTQAATESSLSAPNYREHIQEGWQMQLN